MTSEHLEGLDGVTVCHGALQQLVPHLQLDLLEVVGHGVAGPRPLGVHVHHRQHTLVHNNIIIVWSILYRLYNYLTITENIQFMTKS